MKFLRLPTKRIQIDQKGVPQLLTENWKATRPLIKQQAIQARQAIQKETDKMIQGKLGSRNIITTFIAYIT